MSSFDVFQNCKCFSIFQLSFLLVKALGWDIFLPTLLPWDLSQYSFKVLNVKGRTKVLVTRLAIPSPTNVYFVKIQKHLKTLTIVLATRCIPYIAEQRELRSHWNTSVSHFLPYSGGMESGGTQRRALTTCCVYSAPLDGKSVV